MKTLEFHFKSIDGLTSPYPEKVIITGNFDFISDHAQAMLKIIRKHSVKDCTLIITDGIFQYEFYDENRKNVFWNPGKTSITIFRDALMCFVFQFENEELHTQFFNFQ